MNTLAQAFSRVADFILPPRCIACAGVVAQQGSVCASCFTEIDFITAPYCASCCQPFDYAVGEGALCAACTAEHPTYDYARAVFLYTPESRKLVTEFKYSDRIHAAATYAQWMQRAGADILTAAEVVVPVPLHWMRLWQRRYNQAALLARIIAKHARIAYLPTALTRRKFNRAQASLTRAQRLENIRGAFAISPRQAEKIAGKNVLLVDDVITTGATASTCAKALKQAGAKRVDIITLAKTLRG